MPYRILVLAVFALLPFAASAQAVTSYSCSYDELVRRVEILTEPGVPVPCEVHYYKDTEAPGEHQVLWSAQADASYCQTKTEEFIAKLEGWGWSCSASAGGAPSPADSEEAADEPMMDEPVDDTEALAPAEEMAEEAEEMVEEGGEQ